MRKLLSILLVLGMVLTLAPMALASEEAVVDEPEEIAEEPVIEEEPVAETEEAPAEDVVEEPAEAEEPVIDEPAQDGATHGWCGDKALWSLEDGVLTISGSGRMDDFDYSTYEQRYSTPWWDYKDEIEAVVVKSGVTYIGTYAFTECYYLKSVTIEAGVREIGAGAFSWCGSLESIRIPNTVTDIRHSAFFDCTKLAWISIPSSVTNIEGNAFNYCTGLKDVYYSGTKEQFDMIEYGNQGFENVLFANIHYNSEGPGPVQVTFSGNGGRVRSTAGLWSPAWGKTVTAGQPYGTLPAAKREGYTFVGWFTESSGGTQVTEDTVCTKTTDHYLYAHWTKNEEPEPAEKPTLTISSDAKKATITGSFDGLYARVALVLDNNGVSGLYVTQATINTDGTILIPEFKVPGLKVKGVNVSLVPTLADIQSSTPNITATASKML